MSAVAVSTYDLTYNATHTVAHVTSKMLLLLKDIIREVGLDPGKLTADWDLLERGISTWLRSQNLKQVSLEIFNPKTDALVSRWDLDVVYGYGSDDTFWADTASIRYSIQKAGLVPADCRYRIVIDSGNGADVPGFVTCTKRSTEGFRRYSLGATIGGNGIGTDVAYWRKA